MVFNINTVAEPEEKFEYYKRCAEVLAPLFHRILAYYQQLTDGDFMSAYDKHLTWISQKPVCVWASFYHLKMCENCYQSIF